LGTAKGVHVALPYSRIAATKPKKAKAFRLQIR
jgi:hypothetical protein